MLLYMKNGMKIKNYLVFPFHAFKTYFIELTATEPMDHESLVMSQAMYADDDDSI